MQQEGEFSAGIAFILQDLRDVGVGVARMDGQRQPGQAGGADVGAEVLLLHVARGAVVEVVEAGLADADHPRMLGQRGDGFGVGNRRFRGVVRMDADGAPEVGLRLGQRRKALRTAPAWCRWSPSRPPRRRRRAPAPPAVRPR